MAVVYDEYNGEDVGGAQFDLEQAELAREHMNWIKQDRKDRVKALAGKYVVAQKGVSSGVLVFYQDQALNKGGYWTQYLSNAFGYRCMNAAKEHAKTFKYNNPKVAIVTAEGNYRWV